MAYINIRNRAAVPGYNEYYTRIEFLNHCFAYWTALPEYVFCPCDTSDSAFVVWMRHNAFKMGCKAIYYVAWHDTAITIETPTGARKMPLVRLGMDTWDLDDPRCIDFVERFHGLVITNPPFRTDAGKTIIDFDPSPDTCFLVLNRPYLNCDTTGPVFENVPFDTPYGPLNISVQWYCKHCKLFINPSVIISTTNTEGGKDRV